MTWRTLRDPAANGLLFGVGSCVAVLAAARGHAFVAALAAFVAGVVATYFHVHTANRRWRYEEEAE